MGSATSYECYKPKPGEIVTHPVDESRQCDFCTARSFRVYEWEDRVLVACRSCNQSQKAVRDAIESSDRFCLMDRCEICTHRRRRGRGGSCYSPDPDVQIHTRLKPL